MIGAEGVLIIGAEIGGVDVRTEIGAAVGVVVGGGSDTSVLTSVFKVVLVVPSGAVSNA